jgi:hypothetical protein
MPAFAPWLLGALLFSKQVAMDLPHKRPEALITPTIDGAMTRTEWAQSGSVFALDEAPSGIEALFYGWNEREFFLALQHTQSNRPFTVTFWRTSGTPEKQVQIACILASSTGHQVLDAAEKKWPAEHWRGARSSNISEYSLSWASLGRHPGETLWLQVQTSSGYFPAPPLAFTVP